jgi:nucleoid-associated protein YgaU
MSTESRIGVVAGLFIVVVASVYFFYGKDAPEADFLVSSGSSKATTPSMPVVAVAKETPRTTAAQTTKGKQRARKPAPVSPAANKRLTIPVAQDGPKLPVGPGFAAAKPPRGRGIRKMPRQGGPRPVAVSPDRTQPTILRTGPAPQLVEATRDNLEKNGHAASQRPAASRARPATPDPAKRRTPTATRQPRIESEGRRPITTPPSTIRTGARPTQPRNAWPKRHEISPGDTLSAISVQYYGSSRMVDAILGANTAISNPRSLKVGVVITLPDPGTHRAPTAAGARIAQPTGKASAAPGTPRPRRAGGSDRTHRVQPGDSFYSIARARLGSGVRWEEIYRLNKNLVKDNPKALKPGMILKLP